MATQIREVYLTKDTYLNSILSKIASRLDAIEGLFPDLDEGYAYLTNGTLSTTTAPLETHKLNGTANQITATDNGDGTLTFSLPDPIAFAEGGNGTVSISGGVYTYTDTDDEIIHQFGG